jgi:hypothetical protein
MHDLPLGFKVLIQTKYQQNDGSLLVSVPRDRHIGNNGILSKDLSHFRPNSNIYFSTTIHPALATTLEDGNRLGVPLYSNRSSSPVCELFLLLL